MVRGTLWVTAIFLILILTAACVAVDRKSRGIQTAEEDPPPTLSESTSSDFLEQATSVTGTVTPQPVAADLPDLGVAPELTNQVWLNTNQPLRLADLRGKVVLIDMWTFG